jgi:hypothetical protein
MARMSKEELEGIVERDLPGYTLASPEAADAERSIQAEPDDVGTDIDSLRVKYLGTNQADEEDAAPRAKRNPAPRNRTQRKKKGAHAEEKADESTDDELVAVQPKDAADPFDHAVRPKTVVISGEDGKIVGSQG